MIVFYQKTASILIEDEVHFLYLNILKQNPVNKIFTGFYVELEGLLNISENQLIKV